MKKVFLLLVLTLVMVSCSNNQDKDSNLTFGMAKAKILKGETTQNEILKTFGAPNITTKNKYNKEVWSYNKMSYDSKSKNNMLSLLFYSGGSSAVSKTSTSFDLIITFNENDIVEDYSVISSKF